jgi:hypothetical protein
LRPAFLTGQGGDEVFFSTFQIEGEIHVLISVGKLTSRSGFDKKWLRG